jgi:molybdopterin-guanine dinucleotide biosynthesis protein A
MSPRAGLVVLTGGRSSRMGGDKAVLDAGGMPLAARPAAALAEICDDVVLAGRAVSGVAGRVVADEPGTEGPLAGLVAGLRAAHRDVCVVAGCDMPAIDPGVVGLLLDVLGDRSVDAAVCSRAGGELEPLPLVIRASAANALAEVLTAGDRSLRGGLAAVRTAIVPVAHWSPLDPEGRTFESWNRPSDIRPMTTQS